MMKRNLIIYIIINYCFISNSYSSNEKFKNEKFELLWGEKTEAIWETSLLYIPRLIGHTADATFGSRTIKRVVKTLSGSAKLATSLKKGGHQLADSVLNIPGVIHDVGSDVIGLTKNISHARYPHTNRIQLCTSNLVSNLTGDLTPYHYFNPLFHIGAIIDHALYETTDSQATEFELRGQYIKTDLTCNNIPIMSYQPVNIAIERLICSDRKYDYRYDFLDYNCGGYTLDVLDMSGLGYPQGINWGVGADFKKVLNTKSYERYKSRVEKYCNQHVQKVRDLIIGIDTGENIKGLIQYFSANNIPLSLALYLQIIISSNNSKRLDAIVLTDKFQYRKFIKHLILTKKMKISNKYKTLIKNLTFGVREKNLLPALEKKFPDVYKIIRLAINKQYESRLRKKRIKRRSRR